MVDDVLLRERILEAVNMIIILEGGPVPVAEVRVVTAPMFFDSTFGTSLLTPEGDAVMRVAVHRPDDAVVDTILHETAHILQGPEHIDEGDHGPAFQATEEQIRNKYWGVVREEITRP
jgi:hypothetical protein